MLNKNLLNTNFIKKIEPFCIDFTNSTINGSVKINSHTKNSFYYGIDDKALPNVANAGDTISVSKGSKLYMRGVNKIGSLFGEGYVSSSNWSITGNNVKLSGNIQDLLNDSENDILTATNTFISLFSENTSITDANELVLPAKYLTVSCYEDMFYNCTNLITAPELPATTLARECYKHMFYLCTSLTSVPKFSAITLDSSCCYEMFRDCTSLITAPKLPATTLASNCYYSMFYGCTSLTAAPELPATTLANYCYQYMFNGCTNLITAPELPATILPMSCYSGMFRRCAKLNYIKCLATDISSSYCTSNWLSGVSSTGTFVKNSAMNSWTTGESGIPSGWTIQNA